MGVRPILHAKKVNDAGGADNVEEEEGRGDDVDEELRMGTECAPIYLCSLKTG